MRKRTERIWIRLTQEEKAELDKKVKQSGLSREAFLRRIYRDGYVKEAPPAEYPKLILALSRIGTNINQIAATANSVKYIDAYYLNEVLEEHRRILRELQKSWGIPSKEETIWTTFVGNLKTRIEKRLKAQGNSYAMQDIMDWLSDAIEQKVKSEKKH